MRGRELWGEKLRMCVRERARERETESERERERGSDNNRKKGYRTIAKK